MKLILLSKSSQISYHIHSPTQQKHVLITSRSNGSRNHRFFLIEHRHHLALWLKKISRITKIVRNKKKKKKSLENTCRTLLYLDNC